MEINALITLSDKMTFPIPFKKLLLRYFIPKITKRIKTIDNNEIIILSTFEKRYKLPKPPSMTP